MKITFFSGDITRGGGTEKVAIQIMNELSEFHNVTVISMAEQEANPFFPLKEKVNCIQLFSSMPSFERQYLEIVKRIRAYILNYKPDIIVDVDTVLDLFTVPAAIHTKTKIIAWEHFNYYETLGSRIRTIGRKFFTPRASAIVTLTKEDQVEYQKHVRKAEKVVHIYNPIQIEKTEEYSAKSRRIISVGRLAYQKGFDMLLQVAELVLPKHPTWEWVILGEGENRAELEAAIAANQSLQNVKLLGRVHNVKEYLKDSAIYVMTSRFEGFPLSLIEAKEALLPVISFNCRTGPEELIQDSVNGYLIDCYDVVSMAERLNELISDEQKRKDFSANALLDTDKMGLDTITKQWLALFERVGVQKRNI